MGSQCGRLVRQWVLLTHGHHHLPPSHLGPHGVQDEDMGELWVLGEEAARVRHLGLGHWG